MICKFFNDILNTLRLDSTVPACVDMDVRPDVQTDRQTKSIKDRSLDVIPFERKSRIKKKKSVD